MAVGLRSTDTRSATSSSSLDAERQPLLHTADDGSTPQQVSSEADFNYPGGRNDGKEYRLLRLDREDGFKLITLIFDFFATGICQTSVGALIPSIERLYHLNDGVTAFIFAAQMVGYLCATAVIQQIHIYLGRRGIALLSPSFRIAAAVILATGPPFKIALMTFCLLGFGTGLADAGWCAWATGLPYANICQGMMHGAFCMGCVVGPLASTMILKNGFEWYGFYRFIALLFALELIFQSLAFRHDGPLRYRRGMSNAEDARVYNPFKTSATWLCGLFFFVYVGIESSFSDWIVVFMQRVRHAEPLQASMASSAFWLGMAIGRLVLGFITEYFGLGVSICTYIILSTTLQILFRLIASTAVSLVLLGLNGFFCGPNFPSGLLLLAGKLPPEAQVGAVAAAAAMGQVGGAIAPLGIGFLADNFGIGHLLDVVLGMSILMLMIWLLFLKNV